MGYATRAEAEVITRAEIKLSQFFNVIREPMSLGRERLLVLISTKMNKHSQKERKLMKY